MSGKYALVIGNTEHTDPGLAQLKAPGKDAKEFWRVLNSPDICAFTDVNMLFNEDSYRVAEQIEIFFEKRKPDDLLLLYFSGHGVRDENGDLYLAVRNTKRSRLRSTAIPSDFIRRVMDGCRSRRQVLILDCCNSGAFAQGTKAEAGGSVGTATAFKGIGYGRVILTASDSTQFAWEGDKVIGETENSLFTHFLIKGLEGEADQSGEGRITLDDLYDYAYEQIVSITPNQTPGKWSFKQQGEILLREHIEDFTPLPLPSELMDEIEDKRPYVREAAIQQLIKLVNGRNRRLARSAREALERIAENDDSRTISQTAFQAVQAIPQADTTTKQEGTDRLARQRAKEDLAPKTSSAIERQEKATPSIPILKRSGISTLLASFQGKQPVFRAAVFGLAAVTVIAIAVISFRAFSNPGTTTATEPPTVQSTNVPETQLSTIIPETPTLSTIIPTSGPALEVGSTYPYIDGAVLVAVPAGEFTMGDNGNDRPAHPVTLKDYWIYSTEVTNQQYSLCVSLGNCTAPDQNDNPAYLDKRRANDPVTGVTYKQAANYCSFVKGRLPSEAEWEKAAQDPQGDKYPWGDAAPTCDRLSFNNCQDGMTNVVNYSSGESYYGALDMAGNAFEWVADWYDSKYYTDSPAENPQGPASGTLRSVRSSSYESEVDQVAVAIRSSESPQHHRADLGFRCVVDDPTYFAPFCELPPIYANASSQDTGSLESCPELAIKPVQFCNNNIPFTNVIFTGPSEATKKAQDCLPSGNPNLFTCKKNGETVSISAACQLNDPGAPSCLDGYLEQGNTCVADTGTSQATRNCLAGNYDSTGQCCTFPKGGAESSPALQACPVGTFYAAKAKACLPQPVQELITISLEVTLPKVCTATSGGGGGGGGGGGSGCQASQSQIDSCNAGAPFYHWSSASCSCQSS